MTSSAGVPAVVPDVREVVARMNHHLGPTLVAVLADVQDRALPTRWAQEPDGPVPSPGSVDRLRVAHRVWLMIADAESDDIARAWFVGANPHLDDMTPVSAIRAGDTRGAVHAAQAFVDDCWQG